MPSEPERLLSTGEVAALLGVDRRTVHRWMQQGRLPAVRTPGGHHRYPEQVVHAVLARRPR